MLWWSSHFVCETIHTFVMVTKIAKYLSANNKTKAAFCRPTAKCWSPCWPVGEDKWQSSRARAGVYEIHTSADVGVSGQQLESDESKRPQSSYLITSEQVSFSHLLRTLISCMITYMMFLIRGFFVTVLNNVSVYIWKLTMHWLGWGWEGQHRKHSKHACVFHEKGLKRG